MEENKTITENKEVKEVIKEESNVSVPIKKSNSFLNVMIIILVIVALSFLAIIIFSKDQEKENKKEEQPSVKYDEKLLIDASLATQPLTDAYIEGLKDFNLVADYSNTDPAYTKLINKEVDLIVVTSPSEDESKRAKDANVELEITPVVNEGFVFYTNKENPVNNISLSNIQKIYTGDITNWQSLGGPNAKIVAYQRPANSGSQTGILDLVMKGKKMKEPTKEEFIETMAGIIDVVASYESGKDAIGYSYYYYATTMYSNENLKMFSIDGVEPNHDTIQDGSYPLLTSYYIVTRKGDNREALQKLKETMLSEQGQSIARKAGYVELK